jgi:hypothetical protein
MVEHGESLYMVSLVMLAFADRFIPAMFKTTSASLALPFKVPDFRLVTNVR